MSFFWIVLVPMLAVAFLLVAIASRRGGSAKRRQPSATHDDHSHLLWMSMMSSGVHHNTDSNTAQGDQHESLSQDSPLIMPENSAPDCGSSSSSFDAGSSSFDSGSSSFDSGSSGGSSSGGD